MSGLSEFAEYVRERRQRVGRIEARLVELQKSYESFFQELDQAREGELQQLSVHIATERRSLAPDLDRALTAAQAEVERDYDAKVAELTARVAAQDEQAEATRQASLKAEKEVRTKNVRLDAAEEKLKARNAVLLESIRSYNERIRSMSGGFGFLMNLFRTRALRKEREAIDKEQADVAAQIDRLRKQWETTETAHTDKERKLQDQWVSVSAEAASLRTKLEYLQSSRERIVTRSTLEKVLLPLAARRELGTAADPACPRCRSRNPKENHFCAYCAKRLREDRPDLAGSWEEIAEINHHHALFAEGMKACQELIGLLRGLGSGLENFARSVDDMIATQGRYPLPKLRIQVPSASVSWGASFDRLDQALTVEGALHPVRFAAQARTLVDQVLTEDAIKTYFETMGQELSKQAGAQWG